MAVAFRADTGRARAGSRAIRADAARILRALGYARCELSVAIVDDAGIRRLNRTFRGKDRATDVLAFSQLEERGAPPPDPAAIKNDDATILGDVVISIDTAAAQARELRVALRARIRALLIHGVLHLVGYDHERSRSDALLMRARERELAAMFAKSRARGAAR